MNQPQSAPEAAKPSAPVDSLRQTDSSEAPKAEATASEDQLSPKYAALARKEKAIRAQYQQLQKEKEAIKAKESEYQTNYISKSQLRDLLARDPVNTLNEYGLTQEQLLNVSLNQPNPEQQFTRKLEAKVQALEEKLNQTQTQAEDKTKQAYAAAVNQIRNEAKLLVDSDSRFELIKEEEAQEAIVELIEKRFEEDETVLTVEDAATMIEEAILEEALRRANSKKVQQKLNPPAAAPEMPAEAQKPVIQPKPVVKTLTHSTSGSTPTTLTDRQRRERAILAFRGQLTS